MYVHDDAVLHTGLAAINADLLARQIDINLLLAIDHLIFSSVQFSSVQFGSVQFKWHTKKVYRLVNKLYAQLVTFSRKEVQHHTVKPE